MVHSTPASTIMLKTYTERTRDSTLVLNSGRPASTITLNTVTQQTRHDINKDIDNSGTLAHLFDAVPRQLALLVTRIVEQDHGDVDILQEGPECLVDEANNVLGLHKLVARTWLRERVSGSRKIDIGSTSGGLIQLGAIL